MTAPQDAQPEDPQPRDIAMEQETEEQVLDLEEQSEPEGA